MSKNCSVLDNGITFYHSLTNTILESSQDAYIITDSKKNLLHYNKSFVDMFQFQEDVLKDGSLLKALGIIARTITNGDIIFEVMEKSEENPSSPFDIHKVLNTKDSKQIFLNFKTLFFEGEFLGYILIFLRFSSACVKHKELLTNNLCEDKSVEHFNEKSAIIYNYVSEINKLKEIQKELKLEKEQAIHANTEKSRFLANMSHEIRTPLFGVIGLINLLKKTSLTDEQDRYLDIMQMSAESLMLVINDVLDLAKIESGSLELQNTLFDVQDNVCDMVRAIAARAHDKGLELIVSISNNIPQAIETDLNRLRQVIINLLTNAIKFSDNGEIIVNVDLDSQKEDIFVLHFSVKDNGIGIPPDKQAFIFEPFIQVNDPSKKNSGTGLGLSICKNIVKLMNGSIWVDSIDGDGSTFHFTIKVKGMKTSTSKSVKPIQYDPSKSKKIVLLDENKYNSQVLRQMLEKYGHMLSIIDISNMTVKKIKSEIEKYSNYDICIISAPLKNHHFSDLCSVLENQKKLQRILLTNSTAKISQSSVYVNCEIDGFVIKPVKEKELIHLISNPKEVRSCQATNKIVLSSSDIIQNNEPSLSDAKLSVLLAEDNPVNQLIISKLLVNEGHSCTVVNNGLEALEKFENEHFDFIIMDIEMPLMNGIEATKEIRKLEINKGSHIPIIALSAHALIELMKEALDIGVDYYLTKPFRYEKITDTISEIQQNIYASLYSTTTELDEEKNADAIFNLIPKTPNDEVKPQETKKSDFSIAILFEKLNSDIDFFKVFTEKFIDTTTNLLEEIDRAINILDGNLLSKSAHALKGTLSYVDAQKAVGLTIDLERRGREQDFEYSDIILKRLRIENQKIIQDIIDFIMSNA